MASQPVPPLTVSQADFQRDVARYEDLAQSRPVLVRQGDRTRAVLLSGAEYDRLTRDMRQVLTLDDFSDDDLLAVERTRAPEASRAFDGETT